MATVKFKHWKDENIVFTVVGRIVHKNGDRIVIRKDDGSLEDIIKETIVEISEK